MAAQVGLTPLTQVPSLRVFAFQLLPLALATAGALFTGNFAYLSLSVAFLQILKVGHVPAEAL